MGRSDMTQESVWKGLQCLASGYMKNLHMHKFIYINTYYEKAMHDFKFLFDHNFNLIFSTNFSRQAGWDGSQPQSWAQSLDGELGTLFRTPVVVAGPDHLSHHYCFPESSLARRLESRAEAGTYSARDCLNIMFVVTFHSWAYSLPFPIRLIQHLRNCQWM